MNRIITLVITCTLGLSACESMHFDTTFFNKPTHLNFTPPEGPAHYQQGWKDGCESGLKGYGNEFNKVFFSYKQDEHLFKNKEYYQIWKDAYGYCAMYAMSVGNQGLSNNTGRHSGGWLLGDI